MSRHNSTGQRQFRGLPPTGLLLFTAASLLLFLVLAILTRPRAWPVAAQGGISLGLCAAAISIVTASSVVGRQDRLEVRNFVFVYLIGWADILYVEDVSGVRLVLKSGRRLTPLAFGSSVIASLSGNLRGRRLAEQIRERAGQSTAAQVGTCRVLNPLLPLLGIGLPLVFVGITSLGWYIRHG